MSGPHDLGEPFFAPIDHVLNGVYIGGYRATHFADELLSRGIRHVLKLYPDEPHFPPTFTTFNGAIEDGELIPPDVLRRGVAFVKTQVDGGQPVLVMCGAGISRSATFVLAYMVESGFDLQAAYVLLRAAHPIASPHPNLWLSLFRTYALPNTLLDAVTWMHTR